MQEFFLRSQRVIYAIPFYFSVILSLIYLFCEFRTESVESRHTSSSEFFLEEFKDN